MSCRFQSIIAYALNFSVVKINVLAFGMLVFCENLLFGIWNCVVKINVFTFN